MQTSEYLLLMKSEPDPLSLMNRSERYKMFAEKHKQLKNLPPINCASVLQDSSNLGCLPVWILLSPTVVLPVCLSVLSHVCLKSLSCTYVVWHCYISISRDCHLSLLWDYACLRLPGLSPVASLSNYNHLPLFYRAVIFLHPTRLSMAYSNLTCLSYNTRHTSMSYSTITRLCLTELSLVYVLQHCHSTMSSSTVTRLYISLTAPSPVYILQDRHHILPHCPP